MENQDVPVTAEPVEEVTETAVTETAVTETALAERAEESGEFIKEPAKLMRIASMARAMLQEAREATTDEPGRELMRDIHKRTLGELRTVLSDELREELSQMFVPLDDDAPTAGELWVAQAQLVGWLEGLCNGIQAAAMSQQLAAQAQFQHMEERRTIDSPPQGPGQYL